MKLIREVLQPELMRCDRCNHAATAINSQQGILALACHVCRQGVAIELKSGKVVQRFVTR